MAGRWKRGNKARRKRIRDSHFFDVVAGQEVEPPPRTVGEALRRGAMKRRRAAL